MKAIQYTFMVMLISVLGQPLLHGQTSNQNYMITRTSLNTSGTNTEQTIQYYDGLGRESVQARGGVNTSGKYVYGMTEYDLLGREAKTWLPAVGTTSPEVISTSAMSTCAQNTYGGDTYAFSEITYDALDRPTFISTPGYAWHQNNKGVTKEYITNTSSSVKRYTVASGPSYIVQNGYYPAATLTGTRVTDEDTLTIETYQDLLGNVVLERRISNSNSYNDTYYVYDHGLLRVVVPPLYQSTQEASLLYLYNYDNLGRCISKTLPGCEPVSYWYDSGSRVSFIQDARMSDLGKYRFFLYDGLGRMVVQGLCTNGSIGENSLAKVTFDHTVQGLCGTGYVLQSGYSLSNPEIEIVNYYDGYDCLQTTAISPYVNQYNLQATPTACTTTLLTAQIVAATNGEQLFRVMYYDEKGQLINQRSSHLNGMTVQETTSYAFTGKPLNNLIGLSRTGTNYIARNFNVAYSYDSSSDLLASKTVSGMYIPSIQMYYAYNDLGLLTSESCGSKVYNDYTYDMHGWQKTLSSQSFQGTHMFSQDLYYADGYGTPRYNGNISSMRYNASSISNGYSGYRYEYDKLGRLISSKYCIGENLSLYNYMHSESTEYDANSNITHFTRNGPTIMGYGNFDDIYYAYSGNQLHNTYDAGGSSQSAGVMEYRKAVFLGEEYYYDGCGAMTADLNKGISHIDYDLNGKPTRIQFTNGNVTEYINSADGMKLRTIHRTAVSGLTIPLHQTHTLTAAETMHVDSITYSGDVEIDQGRNTKWYFGEGYVQQTSSGSATTYYTIKDYLGNVRKVMKSDGTIVQAQNYYAFGSLLNETNNYTDIQTHKYNGKELDRIHGLDLYDYGARHYDATIGQFTTMDPLCEKYYHISPYAYCGGNPVNAVDVDGNLIVFINGWHYGNREKSYWEGFDNKVMIHFNDYNARYLDGSVGGLYNWITTSTKINNSIIAIESDNMIPEVRYNSGYEQGSKDIDNIINSLIRDENGVITETMRLVTHSMGAAYAKGYATAIMEYVKNNPEKTQGFKLIEYDFAPYQPKHQTAVKGVKTYQYSHKEDWIAGNNKIPGALMMNSESQSGSHFLKDFLKYIVKMPLGDDVSIKKKKEELK